MNREILFRGKRISDEKWVYGYVFRLSEKLNPFIMLINQGGECYEVNPQTICQYTGLQDDNGTKIFENDIVKVGYTDNEAQAEEISQVIWNKHGYYPWLNEFNCDGCDLFCEVFNIDVIGNIYDNPELLKE
jgi:uncharacterized phage protein (TIGR01671 family)